MFGCFRISVIFVCFTSLYCDLVYFAAYITVGCGRLGSWCNCADMEL